MGLESCSQKVHKGAAAETLSAGELEIDAEVVNVLASNGQPVEYGEPLFRLRPV